MNDDLRTTMAEHDRRLSTIEQRVERQRAEVDELIHAVRRLALAAGVHISARSREAPA